MTELAIALQAALWVWFLGCTVSYRVGKKYLVEGMGIRSAEFIMLCVYTAALVACHCIRPAGKWILIGVLALWFVVEVFCHWYYTLFGAGERKLKGYNECFEGTLRLIPASETRLIPDLYHIVLHLLILLNAIMCVLR